MGVNACFLVHALFVGIFPYGLHCFFSSLRVKPSSNYFPDQLHDESQKLSASPKGKKEGKEAV